MIKLFVLDTIQSSRGDLFPLLKPFQKSDGFTDKERISLYGVSEASYQFVTHLSECDFAVLPMAWNFYSRTQSIASVVSLIKKAGEAQKKVISFTHGDYGVYIPPLQHLIVLRANGQASKLPDYHKGLPVFIPDPVKQYFEDNYILTRTYHPEPTIGFCGQANSSISNAAKEISRTLFRNLSYALGVRKSLPQPIISTSLLRANAIKRLQKHSQVRSNFILRKKYRAGVTTKEDRNRTTMEFYENIKESDYIVCARGGGNFSVRFYETLAMGRIPVFIDSDCILPLASQIDWKEHIVWIHYNERHKIAEKVVAFHQSLSAKKFKEIQERNRKLWMEKLTLGGYFSHFFQHQLKRH